MEISVGVSKLGVGTAGSGVATKDLCRAAFIFSPHDYNGYLDGLWFVWIRNWWQIFCCSLLRLQVS